MPLKGDVKKYLAASAVHVLPDNSLFSKRRRLNERDFSFTSSVVQYHRKRRLRSVIKLNAIHRCARLATFKVPIVILQEEISLAPRLNFHTFLDTLELIFFPYAKTYLVKKIRGGNEVKKPPVFLFLIIAVNLFEIFIMMSSKRVVYEMRVISRVKKSI